ncbi:DNA cytosine methyltransferase [Peptostreptococcus canis]|uniref:Cytosine-specific methyltransferase n=1 Tax=Peptostreptococcus canis TaxID=1159213 RepID=A0ABR6TMB6_9FIRM|nr:DNA cytosine methyltransferase [Peptostreptococcus canis]MBC2576560.1 DNA cytosine methyltransferase [Peptostreptococcus canis]MBP1998748.1 DNA-cytosine methyltransferase [Peptostreptococcus canis]
MKFLDCFSGIGGFRLGLEMAGHECIGHIELDKFTRKSYEAIFGKKEGEFIRNDITKITDEEFRKLRGEVNMLVGGFPCQAFSIAGYQRGFEDTRGTLFFDLARAAKQIQPQVLLFENVKNLLSHNEGQTFETILKTLDELGYDVEWQLLNSKNFGVPQSRERVFVVGHLRGAGGRKVFPIRSSSKKNTLGERECTNTITARYGEAQGTGAYIIKSKQKEKK